MYAKADVHIYHAARARENETYREAAVDDDENDARQEVELLR